MSILYLLLKEKIFIAIISDIKYKITYICGLNR